MIPLHQVLQSLRALELEDLNTLTIALDNIKTAKILNSIPERQVDVETELPSLSIPAEYLPPFIENIFIMSLEELMKNYKNDYSYSDPDKLTNNLSVTIKSYYNDNEMKDGQYPKIAIKCDSMRISDSSLANLGAKGTDLGSTGQTIENRMAWLDFNFYFDVMSPFDTEVDILATKYAMHLTQAIPEIRKIAGLYHIDTPSVNYAQKIREYGDLFLARVSFGVKKEMHWQEITKDKTYKSFIIDLIAVCQRRPECKGFEQFLYQSVGEDNPELLIYLDNMEKQKEIGENC